MITRQAGFPGRFPRITQGPQRGRAMNKNELTQIDLFGKLILDFANISDLERAFFVLLRNTEEALGFHHGFRKRAETKFLSLSDYSRHETLELLKLSKAFLIELLNGISRNRPLYFEMAMHRYIAIYNRFCRSNFVILENCLFAEKPPFDENDLLRGDYRDTLNSVDMKVPPEVSSSYWKSHPNQYPVMDIFTTGRIHSHERVITYCVIKYFEHERHKQIIRHCRYCDEFFISNDIRQQRCKKESCKKAYEREKKQKQRDRDPVKYM
jgi:hypothetical protein